MKKLLLQLFFLFINLVCLDFLSYSQEINITGVVVNSNQEPVNNVHISLKNSPEIYCYSNQSGEFTLTENITDVKEHIEENNCITELPNGGLEIKATNQQLILTIIDLLGRNVGPSFNQKNLNGTYVLYPYAYTQNLPEGIYIAYVCLGSYFKSIKLYNTENIQVSKGLIQISQTNSDINNKEKSAVSLEDTLIFSHDFYKIKKIFVSELNLNAGTVELENFGDYSIATNVQPDKTILLSDKANFLVLRGADSSRYSLNFKEYSTFDDGLQLKAIPVKEFEFEDDDIDIISGIHLEPSGTHFMFPVDVFLELHDIRVSDSLVVFLYDEKSDKIHYLPYTGTNEPFGPESYMRFTISHFSDIGIGYGSISDNSGSGLYSPDEVISYITYCFQTGKEVTDDVFLQWYNDLVKPVIENANSLESLQIAVSYFLTLGEYYNYCNRLLNNLEFYNEAISKFSDKFKILFDDLNTQCSQVNDMCGKKQIAKTANDLAILSQSLPDMEALVVNSICGGEILNVVQKIEFEGYAFGLEINESKQIDYTIENIHYEQIDPKLEWYSEHPDIAKVDENGKVTGIKEGITKIFASWCDIERFAYVRVGGDEPSFCYSNPPPDTNTYHARVPIYGYYYDTITKFTTEIYCNNIIHFHFRDRTYERTVTSSQHTVYTKHIFDIGYVVDFETDASYTSNSSGRMVCHHDNILSISRSWDNFVYPIQKLVTLEMGFFYGKMLEGSGILYK